MNRAIGGLFARHSIPEYVARPTVHFTHAAPNTATGATHERIPFSCIHLTHLLPVPPAAASAAARAGSSVSPIPESRLAARKAALEPPCCSRSAPKERCRDRLLERRREPPGMPPAIGVTGEVAREDEGDGDASQRWISDVARWGLRGTGAWSSDVSELIKKKKKRKLFNYC
jgi:hypothetical protein